MLGVKTDLSQDFNVTFEKLQAVLQLLIKQRKAYRKAVVERRRHLVDS